MFNREERKAHIKRFWQEFDAFSKKHLIYNDSLESWVLYDTDIKGVDLKFDPNRGFCDVIIEVNSKNENRRVAIYEELSCFKTILETDSTEEVIWDFLHLRDNGAEVSRIYVRMEGVDIHKESDWDDMFLFMATNMEILQTNFMDIRDLLKERLKEKRLI